LRSAGAIAVEPSGSLVVIDGDTVRRVSKDGTVTTVAGSPTQSGYVDGAGSNARFNYLVSIAVAPDGTIYVADAFNYAIRKIVGDQVSTLARHPEEFTPPMGAIDADSAGNIYLWNENVPSIFRVTPAGALSIVATDGTLNTLVFGLALAPDGTIYLGGTRTHAIYRVAPGSTKIEKFAGSETSIGNQNGDAGEARFRSPTRLDVASDGRLFVADSNRAIRVGSVVAPPSITTFTLSARAVREGESSTLAWGYSGGSGRIEPGIGIVASSGSLTLTPQSSTTYTLVVSNEGGDTSAEVTLYVTAPRVRPVTRP
jgi:streptogramin lyase